MEQSVSIVTLNLVRWSLRGLLVYCKSIHAVVQTDFVYSNISPSTKSKPWKGDGELGPVRKRPPLKASSTRDVPICPVCYVSHVRGLVLCYIYIYIYTTAPYLLATWLAAVLSKKLLSPRDVIFFL